MDRFCSTCQTLLQRSSNLATKDRLQFSHHLSISDLKAAADASCPFCYAFWHQYSPEDQSALLQSDKGKWKEPDATWTSMGRAYQENGIQLSIRLQEERQLRAPSTFDNISSFTLRPIWSRRTPQAISNQKAPHSDNTASEESWQVIEEWVRHCDDFHDSCKAARGEQWYPTRLLEIAIDSNIVRVITTREEKMIGPYMTISHRWSMNPPITLLRANFDRISNGIDINELPQAFQDAVLVCKRLKVRYLWVDCLCILQDRDDLSDWLREAELMHKVYAQSYLNISAIAATDTRQSFFIQRDPRLLDEIEVDLPFKNLGYIFTNRYKVTDTYFWRTETVDAPLNRRGWVLQERLLAPRVLHFGRNQLLWECRGLNQASEAHPQGLPEDTVISDSGRVPAVFMDQDSEGKSSHMSNIWGNVVTKFSRCSLTNPSDKLVALTGIAKACGLASGDAYVVGMWRSNLRCNLLWRVQNRAGVREESRRPTRYRAPSFSWTSLDGIIEWNDIRKIYFQFEILDINLQPVTDDIFGLMEGGSLLLSCQLQQLSMVQTQSSLDKRYDHLNNGLLMIVNDTEVVNLDSILGDCPSIYLDEHRRYFEPTAAQSGSLFCVPAYDPPESESRGNPMASLLLQVVDAQSGTFRRFGLAETRSDPLLGMMRSVCARAEDMPCVSYQHGKHTIRLI